MATALAMMATLGLNTADFVRGLKTAEDSADDAVEGVSSGLGGLGSAGTLAMGAVAAGAVAAVAAVAAVGVGVGLVVSEIAELTLEAAAFEGTRMTFENLTAEIGGTEAVTQGLRVATGGMVADTDLWNAANKFLLMGLTETSEETAAMSEMAVQLGLAMGGDATDSMENFALMMANQSIPRLDSFGISSGEARIKIEEMMAADENLTKEMAFSTVVMEMGAEKMALVGDQSETAAGGMAQWEASMENMRTGIGQGFIPVLELLMDAAGPVLDWLGVALPEAAAVAGDWIAENLAPILEDLAVWWEGFWPKAQEFFIKFWEGIQPGLVWLKEAFEGFITYLMPGLTNVWNILKDAWAKIVVIWSNDLKPALADLMEALGIGEVGAEDFGAMIGKMTSIFLHIITSGAVQTVIGVIHGLIFVIEMAIWYVDLFKEAWEGVRTFFQNLHIVMPHFTVTWDSVLGVDYPSGFDVDWYAQGGDFMVHSPTIIGVGDKGSERVQITPAGSVPATDAAPASTTEINITANYPQQSETSLAQDLQLLQMLTAGG